MSLRLGSGEREKRLNKLETETNGGEIVRNRKDKERGKRKGGDREKREKRGKKE